MFFGDSLMKKIKIALATTALFWPALVHAQDRLDAGTAATTAGQGRGEVAADSSPTTLAGAGLADAGDSAGDELESLPLASADSEVEDALSEFHRQMKDMFVTQADMGDLIIEYPEMEMQVSSVKFRDVQQLDARGNPLPSNRVMETQQATLTLNMTWQDVLDADLGVDGTRSAVLQLTAARHPILLEKLKAADESKKELILTALRKNYEAHYAIETWWRNKKLAALEEQMAALRMGIDQRNDNQAKYVDAAVTIARLHSDGVSAAPPIPSSGQPQQRMGFGVPVQPSPYYPGNAGGSNSFSSPPSGSYPPASSNQTTFDSPPTYQPESRLPPTAPSRGSYPNNPSSSSSGASGLPSLSESWDERRGSNSVNQSRYESY